MNCEKKQDMKQKVSGQNIISEKKEQDQFESDMKATPRQKQRDLVVRGTERLPEDPLKDCNLMIKEGSKIFWIGAS